jgi:hypothetical protein
VELDYGPPGWARCRGASRSPAENLLEATLQTAPNAGVVLKSHKDIVVAAGAGEFKTLVAAINAVALLRNRVKLCGDSDSKDIDQ